jgi:hypothetical protein
MLFAKADGWRALASMPEARMRTAPKPATINLRCTVTASRKFIPENGGGDGIRFRERRVPKT